MKPNARSRARSLCFAPWAICAPILLASCGANKSPAGEPAPDEAFVDRFCADSIAAECQAIADCYPDRANSPTAECAADRASCLSRVRTLSVGVAAGRLSYDATAARACFDSIGMPTCRLGRIDCDDEAFTGLVTPGGRCHSTLECVDGACHVDGCSGTCVASVGDPRPPPPPLGGDGAPCTGGNDECIEGLGCQDNTSHGVNGGRCGPRRPTGEPCITSNGDQCAHGLTCRGADPGAGLPGACGPFGGRGEPCLQNEECGLGLYCDASRVCADRPGLGGACSWGGTDPFPTCFGQGLVCITPGGDSRGTCGLFAALGEPCSPSCPTDPNEGCGASPAIDPYRPCAADLRCIDGSCKTAPVAACAPN